MNYDQLLGTQRVHHIQDHYNMQPAPTQAIMLPTQAHALVQPTLGRVPIRVYHGTHNAAIFSALFSDREDSDSYCDVIIEVGGKKFPAHKCILGKISPYFDRMFKSKMKEKYTSEANIEGVSAELMETVLKFIYTSTIELAEENAFEVMKVSDYFQMDELKNLCGIFLTESLNAENCLNHLLIAQTFGCNSLSETAAKVVASHFEVITQRAEFNQLNKKSLLDVLKAVNQKKVNGRNMYKASLAWVKHDSKNRKETFVELLKSINFLDLSSSFLQDVLSNEPLVKESHDCKDYLLGLLLENVQFKEDAKGNQQRRHGFGRRT